MAFTMARMFLLGLILLSTIFLRQEVLGAAVVVQIYAALGVSFFISFIHTTFWDQTLRARFFVPSQLVYDLLLTSYLVYLTGVNDSIFLFLYLLNIAFASVSYELAGALLVAMLSGSTYAFIYSANSNMGELNSWYDLAWTELLFLVTALLCGQLMNEIRKQRKFLESQRLNIASLELLNDRLLNSIPVGILLVGHDEYVEKINQTALDLVHLKELPSGAKKYFEVVPELKGVLQAWDKFSDTQRHRFLFSPTAGESAHLSLRIVKGFSPENSPQHILVFQDMAQTMALEEKLEFESKLAATGELAAGIAHEIRNPLASISGSVELLAQHLKPDNESDAKLLNISLRETRRLNTLITDFLEFAKPKDDSREEFKFFTLAEEVAEAVSSGRASGAFTAKLEIPQDLLVLANRERMKQVLFNLFLNACDAARPAAVLVTVKAYPSALEGRICIEVKDNGPGVPAKVAEKIFDPFFTTKPEGTGLGLPTVAQIIKAAKGNIAYVPEAGGALFRIEMPGSAPIIAKVEGIHG